MRVETTRSAGVLRLRHGAGFTTSSDDVVAQARPLVVAAGMRAEPVALAVQPATAEALAAALAEVSPDAGLVGPAEGSPSGASVSSDGRPTGAGGLADFPDGPRSGDRDSPDGPVPDPPVLLARPDGPDRSGQTLAARWARELRALTRARGGVTVIVEHDGGLDGIDGAFWTEFDAALNVALSEVAATVLCLYPQLPLHLEVAEGSRRNHPLLLLDGALRHNPAYREPREVLADRGAPAPAVLGPPDRRIAFDTWQLVTVRENVAQAARVAGCDAERVADLVLAVNEVATNAVEHGSGDAHVALWTAPGAREFLCEVHDDGPLADPLPGLRSPHPSDHRGRGLWIARQLCDLLHVWGDTAGTHVRIRALP
jgi:anti-sigma regulatory factor (Ser/Thr protein kinase)